MHMSSKNSEYYFLNGGGEMGELIRAKDWSKTSLGDPADWPKSLQTMVAVMLDNPFGMYIAWGNEYIQLYNDGYRPILGATKHPQALGISTRETFSEIWDSIIGCMFDNVMKGNAVGYPDFMLPLIRNGYVEECYFNFAYSPIRKDNGEVGGVLVTVTETSNKKKTEEALKESESRFRAIADDAPVFIFLAGENAEVEYLNKTWRDYTGISTNHSKGRAWAEITHIDDIEPGTKIYMDGFNKRESCSFENRQKGTDGIFRTILWKATPRFSVNGQFIGMMGVGLDIDERKKSEKALIKSEEKYRNLFNSIDQGFLLGEVIRDNEGKGIDYYVHEVNATYEKQTGINVELVLSKTVLQAFPTIDKWWIETYASVVDNQSPVRFEKFFEFTNRWFEIKASPAGKEMFTILFTDITERRQAVQKIKESEEQFSTLADNMENLAWLADGEGWIYWYNKRWLEYTGLTLEEMQGWGWQKVHHPDHIDRVMEISKKIWHISETFELTFPLRRHDGEYRWFLTRGYPVTNEEGKIIRWIGTNTDIDEQKKAEEQFRVLADQAPMWVWLTDKEVNVLYANPEVLKFIGIAHYSEFTGNVWEQKVHPEDIGMVYQSFAEAAALQQSFSFDFRVFNAATQDYEWFYIKAVPRLEAGEFTGFIGTGININEQRLILSQLEYRKALLEAHIESSLDGILLVDTKGKILSYNHRFLEIWNIPQEILDDKDDEAALAFAVTQLVKPKQFMERVIWMYENPKEISIDELEFKDGKIIKRYGYHVSGSDGSYYACSWLFRDITEQKRNEDTIKASEAKFRLLADSMPQHIWTSDTEGNLNYFNQSVFDYSGLTLEQINQDGWLQIVHPDDRKENIKQWENAVSKGKDFLLEHRFRRHDGEYRWQLSRAIPQKDANGKIQMWVGTSTDIQEQKTFTKELELQVSERTKELEASNNQLQKMNKELESFAYISSHDLQEPLRKIQTFASRISDMEENNLSDYGKDMFHRMQASANRMQTLIQDLLAYSKTNTTERKVETTDLNDIVAEVKDELKEELQEKHAIIEANQLCEVNVIPFQFRQLLHNLIGNSLKFANPNHPPLIQIKSEMAKGIKFNNEKLIPQNKYCHITVSDNGIGFDQQYSERIFEVFQRLHGKNEYNGTGIGLSIVKKIVENHNGIITAKGELNKGATFEIYIPAN